MQYGNHTVYITGLSKSNNNDPITSMYSSFLICLIIDRNSDEIVDLTINSIAEMTKEFIRSILLGRNILTDLEWMVSEIEDRFLALSQKALIAALKDAQNKYISGVKKRNKNELKLSVL